MNATWGVTTPWQYLHYAAHAAGSPKPPDHVAMIAVEAS